MLVAGADAGAGGRWVLVAEADACALCCVLVSGADAGVGCCVLVAEADACAGCCVLVAEADACAGVCLLLLLPFLTFTLSSLGCLDGLLSSMSRNVTL